MLSRIPALMAAGFSALFVIGAAPAHAEPARPKEQDKAQIESAESAEASNFKNNFSVWVWIAGTLCDIGKGEGAIDPREDPPGTAAGTGRKNAKAQFSDTAMREYWEGYRMTPLESVQDPVVVTRILLLGEHRKYPVPSYFTDMDGLRTWRFLMCSNEEFKADWTAALKAQTEKWGTKLKFTEESQIIDFYDQKMMKMRKALKDEQKRQGIDEGSDRDN
ncbi:hypothetical protein ACFWF7_12895 [Nocardia sp. NPDC060256]|uniref:hypothetical protein n=1 Tax=unclassified Nocardia TaxID=2637762 RepID=UPI003668F266